MDLQFRLQESMLQFGRWVRKPQTLNALTLHPSDLTLNRGRSRKLCKSGIVPGSPKVPNSRSASQEQKRLKAYQTGIMWP